MTVPLSAMNLSELTDCRRCPRLVEWREEVARTKRAAYRDEDYWGRPVPGFGSFDAEILIVGLAPGAHGANRTGRMFTGDRSGDFLFPALHRAGLATSGEATSRDDGLELINTYITSAVKCVPPDNKPATDEKDNCRDWLLVEEWRQLSEVKVIVCSGWHWVRRGLAPAQYRWNRFAEASTKVRPRVGGRPDQRGRSMGARLLSPFAAEHVHRTTDPGDDGSSFRKSPAAGLARATPVRPCHVRVC